MILAETPEHVIYQKFQDFIQKYNKSYSSIEEYTAKYKIFTDNLLEVIAADKFLGEEKHTKSITKFFDMTKEEFKSKMLTLKLDSKGWCDEKPKAVHHGVPPASKDWRKEGKVSPIKDQAQCGSCWAFSTVAFLESQHLIQNKSLATYSEQQLVDCDTAGIDQGCNGGLMHEAFNYFTKAGVEDDKDYPYTGMDDTCAYNKKFVVGKVSNVHCYENWNVTTVKQNVVDIGPLSIAVAADDWFNYDSGILDCTQTQLDHGVLLVGYGTENKTDYWIVKNSWGEAWGEKGFIRINQADGKNCGIGDYIATATLA
jgi:cathepsin L